MIEKIEQDLTEAIKSQEEDKKSVLRMVKAAIVNRQKEKGEDNLSDDDVMAIVSREVKQRKESIAEYEKGDRRDLAEKEKKEIEILEKYLPEQMPDEAIEAEAKKAIEEVDAKEAGDMGKVMGNLMPKLRGKADGGKVQKIVQKLLS